MTTHWMKRLTFVLAIFVAGGALAAEREGAAKERRAPRQKGEQRQTTQRPADQVVRGALPGFLAGAATLPAGKKAVEAYQAEAAEVDREIWQVVSKYRREIVEGGEGVDKEAIAKKAKEELAPIAKRLVESRAKLAEALAAAAKADPDAVADTIAQDFANHLKRTPADAGQRREKGERERPRGERKEGRKKADGEVIQ